MVQNLFAVRATSWMVIVLLLFIASHCKKNPVAPSPPPPDTTSHNFTWQLDSLGDPTVGSSILYDVAIINDTDVWAVGSIFARDSMGQPDPIAYNLARWNGSSWELRRILFFTVCGQQGRTVYPAKSIFVVNPSDIWISAGDEVTRCDGDSQTATMCLPISFSINKLWGSGDNSMYAVGNGGNILCYANGAWQNVQSGTTLDIYDIWGGTNLTTGNEEVLCAASNLGTGQGPQIVSISGTTVTSVSTTGLPWDIVGLWFVPGKKYYVVGGGVFYKDRLEDSTWNSYSNLISYEAGGVRGNDTNDVMVATSLGEVVHYNGSSWFRYFNQVPLPYGYGRIAVKGNLAVCVGQADNLRAVALIGRRVQ